MTQKIFVRVNTEYGEVEVFGDLATAMIYGSDIKPEHWEECRGDDTGRQWDLKNDDTAFIVERDVPLSQGLPEPGSAEAGDSFITKLDYVPSHRTGSLKGLDVADIIKVLGIMPETGNDKSAYDFMFSVKLFGTVHECAIWDYKGSYYNKQWSCYGDAGVLTHLFGAAYTDEG